MNFRHLLISVKAASILALCGSNLVSQHSWTSTEGPNGGVVSSLAVDSEGRIYAGTLRGGVFRSENDGDTWEPVNVGLPSHEIWAIALAPSSNIYAGIGGGFVARSENHGENWTLSTTLPSDVHALLVNNRGHLLAGTRGHGVFRFDDEESGWEQTNLNRVSVQCLSASSNGELYAATNLGLFQSKDEGTTWQKIDIPELYVFSLFVDDNGNIYAGTWGDKLYYSRDGDRDWTMSHLGPSNSTIWSLCVDGGDDLLAGATGSGVYRSGDGGSTWKPMNNGLVDLSVRSIAVGSEGEIFAGTISGVVFRYSSASVSSYSSKKSNSFLEVLSFLR